MNLPFIMKGFHRIQRVLGWRYAPQINNLRTELQGGVLRLRRDETVQLFDRTTVVRARLSEVGPRRVCMMVESTEAITPLTPYIVLGLPLLKRADFERTLYSAVELGANEVQLLQTAKSGRSWGSRDERQRAERIMIAAAEQSKNYALPEIIAPVQLDQWSAVRAEDPSHIALFFDADGRPLVDVMQQVIKQKPAKLFLMLGPEGDLIDEERELLMSAGVIFCALTPTVLRAHQAAALGLGCFRSLLS